MCNCSWQNRDILKADILPFYYQIIETMASNKLEFPPGISHWEKEKNDV